MKSPRLGKTASFIAPFIFFIISRKQVLLGYREQDDKRIHHWNRQIRLRQPEVFQILPTVDVEPKPR